MFKQLEFKYFCWLHVFNFEYSKVFVPLEIFFIFKAETGDSEDMCELRFPFSFHLFSLFFSEKTTFKPLGSLLHIYTLSAIQTTSWNVYYPGYMTGYVRCGVCLNSSNQSEVTRILLCRVKKETWVGCLATFDVWLL